MLIDNQALYIKDSMGELEWEGIGTLEKPYVGEADY